MHHAALQSGASSLPLDTNGCSASSDNLRPESVTSLHPPPTRPGQDPRRDPTVPVLSRHLNDPDDALAPLGSGPH